MKDPRKRLIARADLREKSVNILRRPGIGLHHLSTSTPRSRRLCTNASASGVEAPLRLLSTRWRAPHFDQPVGDHFAEAAERAGDQVASVWFDCEIGRRAAHLAEAQMFRKRHDNFADVLATRPSTEMPHRRAWPGKSGKERAESAFFDKVRRLRRTSRASGLRRREDGVHRDDVKRGIRPQRPERNAGILVNVAFPDLDKPPELSQA